MSVVGRRFNAWLKPPATPTATSAMASRTFAPTMVPLPCPSVARAARYVAGGSLSVLLPRIESCVGLRRQKHPSTAAAHRGLATFMRSVWRRRDRVSGPSGTAAMFSHVAQTPCLVGLYRSELHRGK